jgi:DNA polymerase-3 subunit delta
MQLRADQLPAHLGRELLPIYVVHGDALLALEAADAIRSAARRQGFDEREVMVALTGFDWGNLTASAANLSLFGGKKIIDLRLPSGKPGIDGGRALSEYAANPAPDNLLLVFLPELGWQEEKAAWLGKLTAAGCAVKAQRPTLAELPGWIAMRLSRQQQTADREALAFIADRVEGNLLAAHQEISKLGLLYPPGPVSLAQVRDCVLDVARFDLDSLREALLAGDFRRYARTLDGLHQEGEAAPLILWGVAEEVRALLQARAQVDAGERSESVMKSLRVWGSRQAPFKRALQHLTKAQLETALKITARADRISKGVGKGDAWSELLRVGLTLAKNKSALPRPS